MSPKDQLYQLVADLFEVDLAGLSATTSRDEIERWDSMGTIDLVAQIEKMFKIRFDLLEVEELHTLGILEECLREKGVAI